MRSNYYYFFFLKKIRELHRNPWIEKKLNEFGLGLPTRGTKSFSCDPTSNRKIQEFFLRIPLFQPGASNLRPKQNSNIILRNIGSFCHFPPGFWMIVAQKKVDTFPANEKPEKDKKKLIIFVECSPQSSFWLACPGSHAKPLQEAWKHK
jgi:hypothetical protein